MSERLPEIETFHHSLAAWNIERIIRNSCSETRTRFGPTQYSTPTISEERAKRLCAHSLKVEICNVEAQHIEVRSSLLTRLMRFNDSRVIPDPYLALLLTKPIAHVEGLTAQHSENYQRWIRGEYPSARLEPTEYETTVRDWLKGTIKHRYEQLCHYMQGRHTWDEFVDYWQRLVRK